MIQDIDVQSLTCLNDGACYGDIIRAGRWIAGRVTVGNNDGCSIAPDSGFEYLAHPHLR
jgi:hypothetical protein